MWSDLVLCSLLSLVVCGGVAEAGLADQTGKRLQISSLSRMKVKSRPDTFDSFFRFCGT